MAADRTAHHPPWFDPAMPAREACVLPCLLERRATEAGSKEFIQFANGERWTFAEAQRLARRTAAALRAFGVAPGDPVLVWLPNGPSIIRAWFGANLAGAYFVPLNTSYRGRLLSHVITQSAARVMIVHPDLVPRLAEIAPTQVETLLIIGEAPPDFVWPHRMQSGDPLDAAEDGVPDADVERWDAQMVIFTSGTTGPSKGVLCSYLQVYTVGRATYGYVNADDRMLIDLPMFHVGGVTPIVGALAAGCAVALYDGFSTDRFWERVRSFGATTTSGLVGSMAAFLSRLPPQPDDADNPLRMVVLGPLTPQAMELARRHGFQYCSGFNMTELSTPLVTEIDTRVPASCGKPRSGCECRVVDAHDIECPPGTTGELVVRNDLPWTTCLGYFNRPDATAAAWRNGWFHTGDLVYRDAEGNFFFVDRLKDAIRRRGENISSIEVEAEVYAYPGVAEVAAVGVPSEHDEEEVLVIIAVRPGEPAIDPAQLIHFLIPRMPHFMVPRYVRQLGSLPKTPTNKIQKVELRREGVTPDCWDRVAHGIDLRQARIR